MGATRAVVILVLDELATASGLNLRTVNGWKTKAPQPLSPPRPSHGHLIVAGAEHISRAPSLNTESQRSWFQINDGLPQFATMPGPAEFRQLLSAAPERAPRAGG